MNKAGSRKRISPAAAIRRANEYLARMEATGSTGSFQPGDLTLPLKVGVDLGTSNIVVTVVDSKDDPVAFALRSARAVRDGIVVNFMEAVHILRELKAELEGRLGMELEEAATAIPPGIMEGNVKVISNVVMAAGFRVVRVIDEPEAAALMLGIDEGAVIDIGGGTTGVSVIRNGAVAYSVDEPTGGSHMTLVIAGGANLGFEEAEAFKLAPENASRVFAMVRPVIEKMAHITRESLREEVKALYLAGGASGMRDIDTVFENYTGIKSYKPDNPLLVTPVGIAMSAPVRER
jgi:ethanolamine utilization protein EutJ